MNISKPAFLFDEARILEGSGRQVMAEVNRFFSRDQLEQAAMQDERLRLARELHDGLLQSLSGVGLQLQALSRLVEVNPEAARERLHAIEKLIAQEQRELRAWVEKLQSSAPVSVASSSELAAALNKLRERAQWQWGFRIDVSVDGWGAVPRVLGDQIYRLVQEALTNVGRHARATAARVRIKLDGGARPVHLIISDDGCGFPVRGSFDLAELMRRGIGPRSLRERVASLGGELVLTSELCGSRIEISLPVNQSVPRRPLPKLPSG